MITVMRKHHRWLMIVIFILAIPFIFYFNKTDFSAQRQTDLGRLYDKPVTLVEAQRNARLFQLARQLGMFTFLQDMATGAQTESEAVAEFTWNRLVLHHEAVQLGIKPTNDEIVEFVKTLRPFRGATGFDLAKYTEFTQSVLPSLGFTESHLEELVSDQLMLNRVKDLLGSAVQVAESESMEYYQQSYGKLDVVVVRLNNQDFEKDVQITDEEIAKYYEAQKANLKTEEKRKVEFVTFGLTDEDKKLTGKDRVDALQKLANYANDFGQALLDKGAEFATTAIKFKGTVGATGEFTAKQPDPQFASNPQLTQYSFQLTSELPYSDPIQGPDAFYVIHLLAITEARTLSLEEAKPKIVEALKAEKTRQLVVSKGAEVTRQIREALKAGTPLDKAAEQAGVKLERIPPFSVMEDPSVKPPEPPKEPKVDTPDLPVIKNAVVELHPGETTEFVPTEKGGLVAILEKRAPIDPAAFQQAKATFEVRYLQGKRAVVFYEWLRDRRKAAGVQYTTVQPEGQS
jgi:hypothetical protein